MSRQLLPLVPSVKATNWRMNDDDRESADVEFQHVRMKALERDDRTCQFCGFRAQKYQEVHHVNNDHADNRLGNLVTACSFCHMVQHIGLAGKNKEAVLIWLPEISQDKLHHIVRSILVVKKWAAGFANDRRRPPDSIKNATEMSQAAQAIEAKLLARTNEAEKLFLTSDPLTMGSILQQIANESPALYEKRVDFLYGLRLMPLGRRASNGKDVMPDMVDSWLGVGGPYVGLNPITWFSILSQSGL